MISNKKGIRIWPLLLIVCLSTIGITVVWLRDAGQRQDKVLLTQLLLILAVFLGIIWLLGLSRLTWRKKFLYFGGILLSIGMFSLLFQFEGMNGDLVPNYRWRWNKQTSHFTSPSEVQDRSETLHFDYPQFLGPNRNAVITGIKLNTDWEENPPELVWRQPVGDGWSGFAVVGNSAITQEQEDAYEKVVCYDLHTGKEKWTHKDKARYYTLLAGLGPRATPTINEGKVYTVGSTGILNCLDFETGKSIWAINIFKDNNATPPLFGVSVSPLIVDDLVIVDGGGPIAYYKNSGQKAWVGHRINSGYSSPFLTTLFDIPQVVLFDDALVTSHEPTSGKLLWKQPWATGVQCCAQPITLPNNKLLVSTAYGIGAKLFQVTKSNLTEEFNVYPLWESTYLKAKFTTIIYHKGYLYGLDDGIFVCIDPSDGTRQWKRGRYGHGQTLLIGDVLLVTTESGEIVLLKPDPENHIELAHFSAVNGQTWNTPAIAGNYLLVRNNQEAACYRLPTE